MSKARVATLKQEKHTLAAKKTAKSYKFVLFQPYPSYWPQISDPHCCELRNILEQISSTADNRKHLSFGLSSLIRNIKNSNVGFVLISTNLKPHFIIKQIINLCTAISSSTTCTVRILIVPNLDGMILKCYGFTTFGVSFRHCEELIVLIDWINKVSEQFPTGITTSISSNVILPTDEKMETDVAKNIIADDNVDLETILLKRRSDGLPAFNLKSVQNNSKNANCFLSSIKSDNSDEDDCVDAVEDIDQSSVDDQDKQEIFHTINLFQETGVKRKFKKKKNKKSVGGGSGVTYIKPNVFKITKNVNRPKIDKKKNKKKHLLKK